MQNKGVIPFGPFVINGTNCCRFVRKAILAGAPGWKDRLKLRYLWRFKPMPITIVNLLSHKIVIPESIGNHKSLSPKKLSYSTFSLYNKDNVAGLYLNYQKLKT